MTETREQLESARARLAHEASYLRRDRDKLYDKLRRLENKVRSTIVIGEQIDTDGLYELHRMVPAKPRPTRRQMHNRKMGLR